MAKKIQVKDLSGQKYSDLTRPICPPNVAFRKGNPLISGKSRLVKYYNLARFMINCPDDFLMYWGSNFFFWAREMIWEWVAEFFFWGGKSGNGVWFSMVQPWLLDMFGKNVTVHLVATVVDNSGDLLYPPISGVISNARGHETNTCLQELQVGVSKNRGIYPQIIHFNKVFRFSIIFTIHFGVPVFLETPKLH